jgi:transposase
MRAHSQELRQQVLHAVDKGTSRDEIIKRFHVSRATIKRYLKQQRETGNVLARPIPGRPKVKGEALRAQLARQLEVHPGATLADHCQIWEIEQGMHVSSATMSRAIHAVGWGRTSTPDRNQNVP